MISSTVLAQPLGMPEGYGGKKKKKILINFMSHPAILLCKKMEKVE